MNGKSPTLHYERAEKMADCNSSFILHPSSLLGKRRRPRLSNHRDFDLARILHLVFDTLRHVPRQFEGGEVIQKFVNYRLRLAFVGDIGVAVAASDALRDFVRESNRGRHVWFVADMAALEAKLSAPA